jgi:hypothetical protein
MTTQEEQALQDRLCSIVSEAWPNTSRILFESHSNGDMAIVELVAVSETGERREFSFSPELIEKMPDEELLLKIRQSS